MPGIFVRCMTSAARPSSLATAASICAEATGVVLKGAGLVVPDVPEVPDVEAGKVSAVPLPPPPQPANAAPAARNRACAQRRTEILVLIIGVQR